MEQNAIYTCRVTYTADLFWEAAKRFRRGLFIGMRAAYGAVLSVGAALTVWLLYSALTGGSFGIALLIAVAIAAFSGYKLFTFERSFKKRFLAMIRRPLEEKTLSFYETAFECVGQSENRRIDYVAVTSALESDTHIFLMSRASTDYVAKSDLADVESFRAFLIERLPPVATRRLAP